MINQINKNLLKNFLSLSFVQIINYLTPLLSFPYLIKTLGVDNYGIVTTAFALILFFSSIVDFGFELTGVKAISQNRSNNEELSKIFSAIFFTKLALMLVMLLVYYSIVLGVENYNNNSGVFFAAIGILLSRVFIVNWFFQGVEKMKFITVTNAIGNSIYLVGIFIFISSENDYILVAFYKGLGFLISGLISFFIAYFTFNIKLKFSIQSIFDNIKESFFVFVSILSSSLLQNGPVILVSNIFSFEITGYYSSIEKIISFGKQILMTINQVFFPQLSLKFQENINEFRLLWKKVAILSLVSAFLLGLALFVFQDLIFSFLFESTEGLNEIKQVLSIMLLLLLTYSLINTLGLNALLIYGRYKSLAISQIVPVSVSLSLIFILQSFIDNILIIPIVLLFVDLGIILVRTLLLNNIKEHKYLT